MSRAVKRVGSALRSAKVKSERSERCDDQQGEVKLMFAPNRYIVFSRFNNVDHIHIREYEVKGTGQYPTKRGVC